MQSVQRSHQNNGNQRNDQGVLNQILGVFTREQDLHFHTQLQ